jgi:hypothetical protein
LTAEDGVFPFGEEGVLVLASDLVASVALTVAPGRTRFGPAGAPAAADTGVVSVVGGAAAVGAVGADTGTVGVVAEGVDTVGVPNEGVVTVGVVTEGVVTAGVVTAGVVTAGVVAEGTDTVGTGTDGTETETAAPDILSGRATATPATLPAETNDMPHATKKNNRERRLHILLYLSELAPRQASPFVANMSRPSWGRRRPFSPALSPRTARGDKCGCSSRSRADHPGWEVLRRSLAPLPVGRLMTTG